MFVYKKRFCIQSVSTIVYYSSIDNKQLRAHGIHSNRRRTRFSLSQLYNAHEYYAARLLLRSRPRRRVWFTAKTI